MNSVSFQLLISKIDLTIFIFILFCQVFVSAVDRHAQYSTSDIIDSFQIQMNATVILVTGRHRHVLILMDLFIAAVGKAIF